MDKFPRIPGYGSLVYIEMKGLHWDQAHLMVSFFNQMFSVKKVLGAKLMRFSEQLPCWGFYAPGSQTLGQLSFSIKTRVNIPCTLTRSPIKTAVCAGFGAQHCLDQRYGYPHKNCKMRINTKGSQTQRLSVLIIHISNAQIKISSRLSPVAEWRLFCVVDHPRKTDLRRTHIDMM